MPGRGHSFGDWKKKRLSLEGVFFPVYILGKRTHPYIICVHGSGPGSTGLDTWVHVSSLSRKFCLVVPDLIGFGESLYRSPQKGIKYFLSLWEKQILQIYQDLGISSAHIMGYSLGGRIALEILLRHPEKVLSAVLIAPLGAPFRATLGLARLWSFHLRPSKAELRELVRFLSVKTRVSEKDLAKRLSIFRKTRNAFESMWAEGSTQRTINNLVVSPDALSRVICPVLLLHGMEDAIIPREASMYLADHIPNSQLVFLRGGHWLLADNSEVSQEIENFISRKAGQSTFGTLPS